LRSSASRCRAPASASSGRFLLPDLYRKTKAGETRAAAAEPTAEDRALLAGEPVAGIWAMLQERYRDKPLSLDASPQLDLGVDSLEWMNLSMELEQRFGLRLDEAAVADVVTVRDLLKAAEKAAAAAGAAGGAAAPQPGTLPAERRSKLEPVGPARRAMAGAIYALLRLLMRGLFRLRAEGLDHLPAEGPFVIAANHASDLDPLVVAAALPRDRLQRVWWGGDSKRLFGGPVRRFLARSLRIFPVDDRAPGATLAMALAVLDRGQALVWFPESWRSPTGELQPFLPGIGTVLGESRVPVVPAWIEGAYAAMPRDRTLPRLHPIRVSFGPPRRAGELEPQGEGESRPARIASGLRVAVAELAGTPAADEDAARPGHQGPQPSDCH
jgi:long-chain acyl-CoA synthetase